MDFDYQAEWEDEEASQLKKDFLNYIVSLENNLELAETYGVAGDVRMLEIVEGLQNISRDIAHKAELSNENLPPENYAVTLGKIVYAYFPRVIENEISRISNGISEEGFNSFWKSENHNLVDRICFFKDRYPDLEVDSFALRLKELCN